MIKLIDATDRLSVQVHPDDALARSLGVGKNGKTECWLVLEDGGAERTSRSRYFRELLRLQTEEQLSLLLDGASALPDRRTPNKPPPAWNAAMPAWSCWDADCFCCSACAAFWAFQASSTPWSRWWSRSCAITPR